MPLLFKKTIAIMALAGSLGAGLAPALAADWDDYNYGWGQQAYGQRHWRRGRNGDWDNGAAAAAAAVGGFALGAVAAGAARTYDADDDCYVVDRPIRDGWGNVVDYRRVQVCE